MRNLHKTATYCLFIACVPTICEATATLNTSHENLLFVAAADGATVRREQDNLSYDLDFTTSDGGINIVGVTLIPNTLGSATFTATAVDPTTVRVTLLKGTAAPADYHGALGGALNLSWSHDGVPGNANLNVEMRAVDKAESVVFEGYTSTSLADSDITPITINGTPPFGAPQYAWTPLAPSSPSGLSFTMVNHDGIFGAQTRRWVVAAVGTGPDWTDQNTDFKIEFGNSIGNVIHNPVLSFDLRLRSFSGVTIFEGQTLYSLDGPVSATGAAPGGYTLSTTVDDGSSVTLHPDLGSVDTYSPAAGWDTDTMMDVDVTDGSFCTTLTVRDVDVRFRTLMADGYTIFRGHARGEGVIDTGLPHDTYTVTQEGGASAFPAITAATGTTPLLDFDLDGSVSGMTTPPPASQWGADDTMNILIKDGDRARSRVTRAVSFREFPDELSHFAQQTSATPATLPSSVGGYAIGAVDPNWLFGPSGVPPVFLGMGDPRPEFSVAGELIEYLDGGPRPASHGHWLLVADGDRPWSAGATVMFFLRYLADGGGTWIDAETPLQIPENGQFTVQVIDDADDWAWTNASLRDFDSGSVVVSGIEGPMGNFEATDVSGEGQLEFMLVPAQTNPSHPVVTISLAAEGPSGPSIPTVSEWGAVCMTMLVLVAGSLVLARFEYEKKCRCR